jgi:hypothetical protein
METRGGIASAGFHPLLQRRHILRFRFHEPPYRFTYRRISTPRISPVEMKLTMVKEPP